MTIASTLLYMFAIYFVGSFLFVSVDLLEPNPRLALILKCALIGVCGVAIMNQAGNALSLGNPQSRHLPSLLHCSTL
jgi:hypothetical protein